MIDTHELHDLGKAREGSLAQSPFPVLLQALFAAERTATIELKARQFVKRIALEDGLPVDCESNLLHETPGRFLVEKGKLAEAAYHKALNESVIADERIEQTLLRLQLIQPFELFKLLQQNLAHKLLDCFCDTWANASFKVLPEAPEVKQPLRVNLPQLVFTGASTFSPLAEAELRTRELSNVALALVTRPPHPLTALKLPSKDARIMQELKKRPKLDLLVALLDLSPEELLRKLYALHVLGYVAAASQVPEERPAPVAAAPEPVAAPAQVPSGATVSPRALSADEMEKLRNDVTAAYLSYRTRDAFELFELFEQASSAEVREAFMMWSERFAPWRFKDGELATLQEKARDLFLAGARAYVALMDPEQRSAILRRRASAKESQQRKRSTDFSIKTDMLDGPRQFEEGMKRINSGDHRAAIEFLEFAAACDPRKVLYKVKLAYARFLADPKGGEKQALGELDEALRIEPTNGETLLVMGDIHHWAGRLDRADASYRHASKLMPGDRRPIDAMKAVAGDLAKQKAKH